VVADDRDLPEITPEELLRELEGSGDIHVLDVRAPEQLESGRVEPVAPERFHNVRGSQLLAMQEPFLDGIGAATPLAVICNRGIASRDVTDHLLSYGYSARSVRGGMAGWMDLLVERPLDAPEDLDHLLQFDRIGKGSLSYLLVSDGEALIIDPPRAAISILERAAQLGAQVVAIADTHAHADYISGAIGLSRGLGIPYYLHPDDAIYPYDGTKGALEFEPVPGGVEIELGRTTLDVVHTPGHTDGSVTYVVGRKAAFTGDFLFVASVGRPDLGGQSDEWTKKLWRSLELARESWPESLAVYPAHYASESERRDDKSVGGTFGAIQKKNQPLAMTSAEDFATWVKSKETTFPEAYKRIKAVNIGLVEVNEEEAQQLEIGKNECAVG
jgi:glyoxylase-like metal-dependent hydrolase (beta-lactamase superfamily II)/rhodanese-related sulfurtransferase